MGKGYVVEQRFSTVFVLDGGYSEHYMILLSIQPALFDFNLYPSYLGLDMCAVSGLDPTQIEYFPF